MCRARRRHAVYLWAAVTLWAAAPADAQALSPYRAVKARAVLRDKLPCLGCHALDGEGGRIGPDLSRLPGTLSPAVLYSMIRNPQGTRPGSLMPGTPMSRATLDLVVGFLGARRAAGGAPAGAASGTAAPRTAGVAGDRDARTLYATFCAACHGSRGRGDGFNAQYLPVAPAVHADPVAMSWRTDDRLFDAIAVGGAVVGRSPRMPAFGATLSRAEIRSLVRYIRELCRCEGPAWSR